MFSKGNITAVIIVFVFSFFFFMCLTSMNKMSEPAFQTKIIKEMQEELQSTFLSPGRNKKLTIKQSSSNTGKKRKDKGASEDNQSQNFLTKD